MILPKENFFRSCDLILNACHKGISILKMKTTISAILLVVIGMVANAQYKTVNYNHERNWFNESEPLPAETHFILNGPITPDVSLVEIRLYRNKKIEKKPIYRNSWSNPFRGTVNSFLIPVQHKLVGSSKYTIVLAYFRTVSFQEKQKLQALINDALDAYIRQMVESNASSVSLRKNPKLVIQDLNSIVQEGTKLYRSSNGLEFTGFSDLVMDKLVQLDELKLRKAKFNMQKESDDDRKSIKVKYLERNLTEIQALCRKEVAQFVGSDLLIQIDLRLMEDYPTEKVKKVVPINAGVIGVYSLGPNSKNAYGVAPSVGVSIPLGRRAFDGRFWSNSSISLGISLLNFDFGTETATGPIIQRPFYIGYGYRAFNIMRFNAGVVALQTQQNGAEFNFNNVYLSPQVGVSIELGLWLGMIK